MVTGQATSAAPAPTTTNAILAELNLDSTRQRCYNPRVTPGHRWLAAGEVLRGERSCPHKQQVAMQCVQRRSGKAVMQSGRLRDNFEN